MKQLNASNIIEIKNLGLKIDDTWIHRHLNLTIPSGEIFAIVGGSGSGKTMLLKQMLRLEPSTTGSIKILGVNMLKASEEELDKVRKSWGVVFQADALFSSFTALENIAFPLMHFTHLDTETIQQLSLLKLKLVGLSEETANKYPSELSGGMQKRVAIARACVMDPPLLFLDEPTAGLDPKAANEFDELILLLQRSLGLSVVIITHDIDTLWHLASQVAFLGEGKILEVGTMQALSKSEQPLVKAYFSGPRAHLAAAEYK